MLWTMQASRWRDPLVVGTVCGLISAIGYTAANICLRAVADYDPIWVSCIKAAPTVVLVSPWFLVRAARRQPIVPPRKALGRLILAALIGQIFGNILFQWSLGVVGIALTVPLTLGSLILGGAVLGWLWLGEEVTLKTAGSILALVAAIAVLSQGADEAYRSLDATRGRTASLHLVMLAGVGAACLSGVAYAVLSVVVRHGVTGQVALSTTLVTVTAVGVISLGTLSYFRIGTEGMLRTEPADLLMMIAAGVWNALAFLALVKALQTTTVVYVNALNATQATMAALAGVLIFDEALSGAMALGVALTIFGLMLMQRRRPVVRADAKEVAAKANV